jgi:hypothetical protein
MQTTRHQNVLKEPRSPAECNDRRRRTGPMSPLKLAQARDAPQESLGTTVSADAGAWRRPYQYGNESGRSTKPAQVKTRGQGSSQDAGMPKTCPRTMVI